MRQKWQVSFGLTSKQAAIGSAVQTLVVLGRGVPRKGQKGAACVGGCAMLEHVCVCETRCLSL